MYDIATLAHAMTEGSEVDKYPKVKLFLETMRALPVLREFFASPAATYQFNSLYASFGGGRPSPAA